MESLFTSAFAGCFCLIPVFIVVIFVLLASQGIAEWHRNNQMPIVGADVRVIAKRAQTHGGGNMRAGTRYFATFEFATGHRLELQIPSNEIGMIAEGDEGTLTHQGTRYKGFLRRHPGSDIPFRS